MGITCKSAMCAADRPGGWRMLVQFQDGRATAALGVSFEPPSTMWEWYDYERGFAAGEIEFEEANGILMEDGDE